MPATPTVGIPEVQITNPSGGVLGGDRLDFEVSLAPGSSATVLTQAASKAYREARGNSTPAWKSRGRLPRIPAAPPDPLLRITVPATNNLPPRAHSHPNNLDACAAGRVGRGERFAFTNPRVHARILRNALPEAIDGLDLAGGAEHFEGYSYLATAYVSAPRELGPLADHLHDSLSAHPRTLLRQRPAPVSHHQILTTHAYELYRSLNQTQEPGPTLPEPAHPGTRNVLKNLE